MPEHSLATLSRDRAYRPRSQPESAVARDDLAGHPGRHAAVHLTTVAGCDHFGLIDPDHPAFATVLATVRTLAA